MISPRRRWLRTGRERLVVGGPMIDSSMRPFRTASTSVRRWLGWGLIDQIASSGTSFALTILGGRLLGPHGLGIVTIGFVAYVLCVTALRALVTEPLVVASSNENGETRDRMTHHALSIALATSAISAGVLAAAGILLPGTLGTGLLIFAPWMVPALVQEYWRAVLFRDHRGAAATVNDSAWLIGFALATPLLLVNRSVWSVVACWGIGATLATLLGIVQVHARPGALRPSWATWQSDLWPLGRWLAASSAALAASGQAVILVIAVLVGAGAVGGLRAAQTLFAPLSVLGSAALLPGLPALTRAQSLRQARLLALKLSGILVVLTFAYLAVAGALAGHLMSRVFGSDFARYDTLLYPVGSQQLVLAGGMGFLLLLKATARGQALTLSRTIGSMATVALVALLSTTSGLTAAAWGLAAGTALISVLNVACALAPRRPSAQRIPAGQQAVALSPTAQPD